MAKLDMKSVGWLGMWGAWHRVEGAITSKTAKKEILGTISGCWDKKLVFKCAQTSKTDTLYDYEWAAAHARLQMVSRVNACCSIRLKAPLSLGLGRRREDL